METPKTHFNEMIGNAIEYLETRFNIVKLDAADAGASAASALLTWIVLVLAGSIMIVFFSIAGALGIGYAVGNHAIGFSIVGGIYLIAIGILYNYRKVWLRQPIGNKIIEAIYEND